MKARHRLSLITLLWLVIALVFAAALATDWTRVWSALGVHSLSPSFADLRTITAGLESTRLGADPLRQNPRDPWGRTLNYPRLWLSVFGFLGISDANLPVVGLLFSAAYLAGISLLMWRATDVVVAGAIGLCALSGSSLLAMERGNNDLVIFSLVLGAVLSPSLVTSAAALTSAIALKLYPLAGIGHLVTAADRPRRRLGWTLSAVALLVIAASAHDLPSIVGGTPSSFRVSYGVRSLHAGCGEVAARLTWLGGRCGEWSLWLAAWTVLVALSLITVGLGWRARPSWGSEQTQGMPADLFVAFAAIYTATYFTGSHWDYRLIFLIPTLPFLIGLARHEDARWLGGGSALLVALTMNASLVVTSPWTYLGHLAKACLAFACLFLLVAVCRARLAPAYGVAHA